MSSLGKMVSRVTSPIQNSAVGYLNAESSGSESATVPDVPSELLPSQGLTEQAPFQTRLPRSLLRLVKLQCATRCNSFHVPHNDVGKIDHASEQRRCCLAWGVSLEEGPLRITSMVCISVLNI